VTCYWIEPGEGLVKHQQIWLSSERQSERELGLLATG
jgi:hypothetical protein